MKLRRLLTLPIILATLLTSCYNPYAYYTTSFFGTFNTIITIVGYTKSRSDFDRLSEHAHKRFVELNQLFDIYSTYDGINNVKTINDNAGKAPVKVSPEIIGLLELSVEWYDKTNGKVNVALGSVLKIWHNYRDAAISAGGEGELPSMDELNAAALHTDINSIVIDRENGTVYIKDPDTLLDVGAVAKGYATQLVTSELRKMGFESFAINAGGNVEVVGTTMTRDKKKWVIGIQAPDENMTTDPNEGLLDKVLVSDTSIVTSGVYQRYYMSGGKRYHHIIDPKTLMPSEYYEAVTVISPDSGLCDILSTALFLMPYDEAADYIKTLDNVEALFVMSDGSIKTTEGMDKLLMSKTAGQ